MQESVRLVSESEIIYVLAQMDYHPTNRSDALVYYTNPAIPYGPITLDYVKGPIPYEILLSTLELQGINVDAFVAHLEEITVE